MITGKIKIKKGETLPYSDILDFYYMEVNGMLKSEDITEKNSSSNDPDIINASCDYDIVFNRKEGSK